MAKTYAQIQKQIEQLKQEAESLRKQEISGVITRIRDAIEHYGLTADEIFPAKGAKAARKAAGRKAAAKAGGKKPANPPKYRDEAGHEWTGRGKRPNWFKAALAAGKTAADLEIR